MAANNILFREYLRILTPEEINDLTSGSSGVARISLTDVLHYKLVGEEINLNEKSAKILPFRTVEVKDDVKESEGLSLKAGPNIIEAINRFYIRKKE